MAMGGYTSPGRMVLHTMVTTQFELDGFRVTRTLGVVRGIVVRSRSIFGTIGASLQTLVGGNITLLTDLCERTRAESFELMLQHAAQLGANGVVGIRYDATEVMQGVTEVLAYGTAVLVEIYDQSYNLRGTDAEYIRKLAEFVDGKMRSVAEKTSTIDSLRLAVLAALNIADEYHLLKKKYDSLSGDYRQKAGTLANALDEVLDEGRKIG